MAFNIWSGILGPRPPLAIDGVDGDRALVEMKAGEEHRHSQAKTRQVPISPLGLVGNITTPLPTTRCDVSLDICRL